jgi:hypothetical protein
MSLVHHIAFKYKNSFQISSVTLILLLSTSGVFSSPSFGFLSSSRDRNIESRTALSKSEEEKLHLITTLASYNKLSILLKDLRTLERALEERERGAGTDDEDSNVMHNMVKIAEKLRSNGPGEFLQGRNSPNVKHDS